MVVPSPSKSRSAATEECGIFPVETDGKINAVYLYAIVLVAALGGFIHGYDLSLISGAVIFLKTEYTLNPFWFGAVTGSFILGCSFGPLAGAWLADTLGRKRTLFLSALLFSFSTIGCAMAGGMTDLIVWRFLGGMGAGLATTVSPMYIAEVAPARLRGRLVVLYQLSIVTGLFLSVCITYLLSFGGHWRWMFATQGVPVVVLLAGLLYVPESPRWLATVGQYTGAIRVLTRINGSVRAEKEIQEIQSELREESGGFGELLHPGIRTAAILGIVLMVFLQINGVNMILIYAPTLFMEARSTTTPEAALLDAPDAILNSVYIAAWITLCTVFAIFLAGRFNRRSLLICGAIVMAFGHALMFLSFIFHMPALFILSVMLVPTGAYTLLLAPTGWVVLSEILPNRIRGKAMSLTTCAMYAASYATTHLFPMMMKWFEKHFGNPGGTWLVFMGVCLTGFLFIWRFVPETKDKTLEEISAFWIHKGRRSAGQCMHEKGGTA